MQSTVDTIHGRCIYVLFLKTPSPSRETPSQSQTPGARSLVAWNSPRPPASPGRTPPRLLRLRLGPGPGRRAAAPRPTRSRRASESRPSLCRGSACCSRAGPSRSNPCGYINQPARTVTYAGSSDLTRRPRPAGGARAGTTIMVWLTTPAGRRPGRRTLTPGRGRRRRAALLPEPHNAAVTVRVGKAALCPPPPPSTRLPPSVAGLGPAGGWHVATHGGAQLRPGSFSGPGALDEESAFVEFDSDSDVDCDADITLGYDWLRAQRGTALPSSTTPIRSASASSAAARLPRPPRPQPHPRSAGVAGDPHLHLGGSRPPWARLGEAPMLGRR